MYRVLRKGVKMNNKVAGVLFIVAGLLFIFHDYYAGTSESKDEDRGKELNVVDLIMGFFMLGLGGYFIFTGD